MTDVRDEVCDEADVVHSLSMVVLWAMQELLGVSVSRVRIHSSLEVDRGPW